VAVSISCPAQLHPCLRLRGRENESTSWPPLPPAVWLPHPTQLRVYVYSLPETVAYKKPHWDVP
jgi:hypothetical protein